MPAARLVLASRSPRRQALLDEAGIAYDVGPYPDVDETWPEGAAPDEGARLLAERKARAVAPRVPTRLVLCADTVVAVDCEVLGKPRDRTEARAMLARLSGRRHQVATGVALALGDRVESAVATTSVTFRSLSAPEIDAYVATGEPLDKAGAYGIQGGAAAFVTQIEGPIDTVIGLPLDLVRVLLGR